MVSDPPKVSVAGPATVTAAPSDSRLALLSVRLPLLMVKVSAAVLPLTVLAPVESRLRVTMATSMRPPLMLKLLADKMPEPLTVPASVTLSSAWSPASVRVPGAATLAEPVLASRPLPTSSKAP